MIKVGAVEKFDLVIIDEASQMQPAAACIAMRLLKLKGHLLVAGDHEQLAPIVSGDFPINHSHARFQGSILDALRLGQNAANVRMMKKSFRVPKVIAAISQSCYGPSYNSRRRPRPLELFRSKSKHFEPLVQMFEGDGDHGAVLVAIDFEAARPHGMLMYEDCIALEAEVVKEIISCFKDSLKPSDDHGIFVVTPHRVQRAANKPHVEAVFNELKAAGKDIKFRVDTVERMQGDESRVVICCYAAPCWHFVGSNTASDQELKFIFNRPRFNVAITRTKEVCFLLVDKRLMERGPPPSVFWNSGQMQAWQHMLRFKSFAAVVDYTCVEALDVLSGPLVGDAVQLDDEQMDMFGELELSDEAVQQHMEAAERLVHARASSPSNQSLATLQSSQSTPMKSVVLDPIIVPLEHLSLEPVTESLPQVEHLEPTEHVNNPLHVEYWEPLEHLKTSSAHSSKDKEFPNLLVLQRQIHPDLHSNKPKGHIEGKLGLALSNYGGRKSRPLFDAHGEKGRALFDVHGEESPPLFEEHGAKRHQHFSSSQPDELSKSPKSPVSPEKKRPKCDATPMARPKAGMALLANGMMIRTDAISNGLFLSTPYTVSHVMPKVDARPTVQVIVPPRESEVQFIVHDHICKCCNNVIQRGGRPGLHFYYCGLRTTTQPISWEDAKSTFEL
jgi:hypothetical protein